MVTSTSSTGTAPRCASRSRSRSSNGCPWNGPRSSRWPGARPARCSAARPHDRDREAAIGGPLGHQLTGHRARARWPCRQPNAWQGGAWRSAVSLRTASAGTAPNSWDAADRRRRPVGRRAPVGRRRGCGAHRRFGIHPRAAEDCARRNPVPKVHVYPGHVFVVLHGPQKGKHGHIHYLELDQFVGPDWVVTVHGPLNPAVPLTPRSPRPAPSRGGWRADGCARPREPIFVLDRQRPERAVARPPLHDDRRGVAAGAPGHRRRRRRSRTVPRGDVRRPPRAPRRLDDGHPQPRGLRPDGDPRRCGRRGGLLLDPEDQFLRLSRDGRGTARVPAGGHRVLPGADEHEDDHRGRAAGRDRRGHPADHRPLLRSSG